MMIVVLCLGRVNFAIAPSSAFGVLLPSHEASTGQRCQQETQEPEGAIDLWRPASAQAKGLPYGLGDEQRLTQVLLISLVTPSSSPARCASRPEQPTATLH
jgi:hypothetical protein